MEKNKNILKQKVKEVGLDEFLEIIIANLIDYLPAKYQDQGIYKETVDKVNETRVGFRLGPKDSSKESGFTFGAVYYIEDAYKCFEGETIEDTLAYLAKDYVKAMDASPTNVISCLKNGFNADLIKETVICQLINADANEKILQNIPHRRFHDFHEFAVIYRMIFSDSGDVSAVVTYNMADKFGFSEEQLYNYAMENTKKMAVINTAMGTIMAEIMDEELGDEFNSVNPKQELYYISNRMRLYGASTILIEEKLYGLATKLDSDLYLIPSSIHEMLALSVDEISPESLADMIMKVNTTQIEPQERLSNSVYMYSREKRDVSIVQEVTKSILAF